MKKIFFLLSFSWLFISCNQAPDNIDVIQVKIDSIVNAKTEILKAQMKAKNDSLINNMALQKADSILKSMKK
jgi:hypothetical protein